MSRVECGGEFSVLVTDNGILMTCGRGDTGVQGHHDNQDCLKPKLVEDLITHDVVQVSQKILFVPMYNIVFSYLLGHKSQKILVL